jgi:hypothetical protein
MNKTLKMYLSTDAADFMDSKSFIHTEVMLWPHLQWAKATLLKYVPDYFYIFAMKVLNLCNLWISRFCSRDLRVFVGCAMRTKAVKVEEKSAYVRFETVRTAHPTRFNLFHLCNQWIKGFMFLGDLRVSYE